MTNSSFGDLSRLSHAYIISLPAREENLEAAYHLAAAAMCTGTGKVPCGVCRDCRKVLNHIHPDLTVVSREKGEGGKEKKEILVEQVRGMVEDVRIMPNEGKRKVYIIDEADKLNIRAQNAALKLLEEPPAYALFLLCAVNPEALLVTIQSRCSDFRSLYDDGGRNAVSAGNARDDAADKLAGEYIRLAAGGNAYRLICWCTKNETMDSRAADAMCRAVMEKLADIMAGRAANPGLTTEKMMELCRLMNRCCGYISVNTGIKHIFGMLSASTLE